MKWKRNWVAHEASHLSDKKYTCDNCHQTFSSASTLVRHLNQVDCNSKEEEKAEEEEEKDAENEEVEEEEDGKYRFLEMSGPTTTTPGGGDVH